MGLLVAVAVAVAVDLLVAAVVEDDASTIVVLVGNAVVIS